MHAILEVKQKIIRSNLNGNALPFQPDKSYITKLQEKNTAEQSETERYNIVKLAISTDY